MACQKIETPICPTNGIGVFAKEGVVNIENSNIAKHNTALLATNQAQINANNVWFGDIRLYDNSKQGEISIVNERDNKLSTGINRPLYNLKNTTK